MFTEEELSGLSDEERLAIQDDEDEVVETEAETEPEPPAEEVKDETVATEPPPEKPPEVPKAQGAEETPDENAEKKASLQTELEKLDDGLDEGDFGLVEYNKKRDAVKQQIFEIEMAEKIKTALESEYKTRQEEQLKAQWQKDQDAFFAENDDLKNDNALFKVFAKQANLKVSDPEYSTISNTDLLKEAAKEARAILGMKVATNDEVAEARRNANKSAAKTVQTLAEVPAAQANEDGGDPVFAAIDKLLDSGDTEALEAALAKMTPEQMDKYAMI